MCWWAVWTDQADARDRGTQGEGVGADPDLVGPTLESGEPGQALGALLLFASNVAAIVATGSGLLLALRVRAAAETTSQSQWACSSV